MDRFWLIGGGLVLAIAAFLGWLSAGSELRLQSALVLADTATPGCDRAGQVHLVLGNAADQPMQKVTGVLSVTGPGIDQPTPVGNFEISGPVAPGQKVETCAALDESLLGGRDRTTLDWLARATAVEFGEAGAN